ncbi:MAG: N-acetyltransferase [Ignavibacterium sp.]|nr:N-acetyltransferase [Ignavibacterium sp.]
MEVKHDKLNQRFVLEVEGQKVYTAYSLDNNVMDIYTTYTPPNLRGRGLAEKVVRAALEFAKENKYKVIPSCSYVSVFIQRHNEYADLIK